MDGHPLGVNLYLKHMRFFSIPFYCVVYQKVKDCIYYNVCNNNNRDVAELIQQIVYCDKCQGKA